MRSLCAELNNFFFKTHRVVNSYTYIYIVNICVFALVGKISDRFWMQRRIVSAKKVLF